MIEANIASASIRQSSSSYKQWVETEGIPLIESFFIEDIAAAPRAPWLRTGGLGVRLCLEGTGETNDAYICEIPAGNDYSLLWPRGKEIKRFDWKPGSLVVPPGDRLHQHCNAGAVPVRCLALRWGSQTYHRMWGEGGKADVDVKLGGNQIEYQDKDPLVRQMFAEACAKAGVTNLMAKHHPTGD